MKRDKLTPKQEKFVREYIKTGNATEAFKRAYNAENMLDATINSRACVLAKQDKIRARIKEFETELKSIMIAEKTECLEYWTEVMRDKSQSTRNRLEASEKLAKFYQLFVDKKELDVRGITVNVVKFVDV